MKKCIAKVITLGYEKRKKHIVTRVSLRDDNTIIEKVKKIKFGVMVCNSVTQKVSLSKILTA